MGCSHRFLYSLLELLLHIFPWLVVNHECFDPTLLAANPSNDPSGDIGPVIESADSL
jgi:hypothetical protein